MFSNIKRVDIEFHSRCNRTCEWCPNKFFDRISEDKYLNLETYKQLLLDLYNNNLGINDMKRLSKTQGVTLSFLGYQEPFLAIDKLNEYLSIAKQIFRDRNIKYVIHSNGDFITEENLSQIKINELNIMDYDCKGEEYWKKWLKEKKCYLISIKGNRLLAIHNTINLVQIFLNWPKTAQLENRGGSLNKDNVNSDLKWKNDLAERKYPCYETSYYLNIYHDGSVMPCCHLRPDNPDHEKFIMGNLNETSIVDIVQNEKFLKFKNNSLNCIFPKECLKCNKTRADLIQLEEDIQNESKSNYKNYSGKRQNLFRVNKEWNETQNQVWNEIQKYYYRFELNGKKYPKSYYFLNNLLFDKDLVKNLEEQIKLLRKGRRGRDKTKGLDGKAKNFEIKSIEDKRRRSLEGLFGINPELIGIQQDLKGKHIVIFDDNISSGATLDDICLELQKHGVASILPITLAIIPKTVYGQEHESLKNK